VSQKALASLPPKLGVDKHVRLEPVGLREFPRRPIGCFLVLSRSNEARMTLVLFAEAALELAGLDEPPALLAPEVQPSNFPFFVAQPATTNVSRCRHVVLVHRLVRPDS